ncbi:putative cysteine-rich receptor-like protein kinase 23 [Andrographis paniculata]|uniref:putative cysteine-rich receptor-like protein kinase 23 n=1 Tax=Andrographis paniculata TaxID=175694 RepID=UPI0021E7F85D|nr:putative cysteine-rich receptor-like protein kinase 23 [Andrographis paniculata]
MSAIYDNWERLVAAAVKKQQLWELFHAASRSPSILSEASDYSSSSRRDWGWLEQPPKLVLLSDFSPTFDLKDLSTASVELLGKGTFGSSYSAMMGNGVRIVLKRLNLGDMSELDFKRYVNVIANVRQGNVAPLRGYYAYGDERILLYDYYREGSVYALLHGKTGVHYSEVSWKTRQQIAIGAARAIAAIHKKNGGKLVHGNIKSSNVFLSPQVYCCVSDLGLANMIETMFMPSARCYAPEIKNSRDVSQESDVYSFGILLLELLTRKPAMHVPGGPEAIDLVKLVSSGRTSKIFDSYLLQNPAIKNDMIELLQIGMKCATKSIKKRPKMSEVVKMLEVIIETNSISRAPPGNDLIFLMDFHPRFDLDELLRASAEVLGKGTFGTAYKAKINDESIVVVKRLKVMPVTFEAFQEHMEVFGRMNHKNIADVVAYYYSSEEKLVIYQYYDDTSVSSLLHESYRSATIDWKTRLKIATDTATGIAHIHAEDDGKLVHGNIKSSNIFFTYKAIVADAGYPKLFDPINLSTRHWAVHAPEGTNTGNLSQASDIYSFGVLLVELLSGLPMVETLKKENLGFPLLTWLLSLARDGEWINEVVNRDFLWYQNEEEKVEMIQLLQIAMDCLDSNPQRRPGMSRVVEMLEDINGGGGGGGGVTDNELRLVDGVDEEKEPSIESKLEEILELLLLPTLMH